MTEELYGEQKRKLPGYSVAPMVNIVEEQPGLYGGQKRKLTEYSVAHIASMAVREQPKLYGGQ